MTITKVARDRTASRIEEEQIEGDADEWSFCSATLDASKTEVHIRRPRGIVTTSRGVWSECCNLIQMHKYKSRSLMPFSHDL